MEKSKLPLRLDFDFRHCTRSNLRPLLGDLKGQVNDRYWGALLTVCFPLRERQVLVRSDVQSCWSERPGLVVFCWLSERA